MDTPCAAAGAAPLSAVRWRWNTACRTQKSLAGTGSEAVRFLGFKNQSELPAYYDLCDVFVMPTVFEPWGLVVNEVMNAGKAVIASDQVGCAPDLVRRRLQRLCLSGGRCSGPAPRLADGAQRPNEAGGDGPPQPRNDQPVELRGRRTGPARRAEPGLGRRAAGRIGLR